MNKNIRHKIGSGLVLILLFCLSQGVLAKTVKEYAYDALGNIVSIKQSDQSLAIYSFFPSSGPVGSIVTIHGNLFSDTAEQNAVSFNGASASILSATESTLIARVPQGATSGSISVTIQGNTASSENDFVVTEDGGGPIIYDFWPKCGTSGTTVTVRGDGFDPSFEETQVSIGGVIVIPSFISTKELSFSVPSDIGSDHIKVLASNKAAVSDGIFFIPPVQSINCSALSQYPEHIEKGLSYGFEISSELPVIRYFEVKEYDLLSLYFSNIERMPISSYLNYAIYNSKNRVITSGNSQNPRTDESKHLPIFSEAGTYVLILSTSSGERNVQFNFSINKDTIIEIDELPERITSSKNLGVRVGFWAELGDSLGIGISGLSVDSGSATSANVYAYAPNGSTYSNGYGNSYTSCQVSNGSCDVNLFDIYETGLHTITFSPLSSTSSFSEKFAVWRNIQSQLNVDNPYRLTTDEIGQDGWLTFEGTEGESATINISGLFEVIPKGGIVARAYIYGPDKKILVSKNISTTADILYIHHLPTTGLYHIFVNPNFGRAITALITLDSGENIEPDNDKKQIRSIAEGGVIQLYFEASVGESLGFALSDIQYDEGNSGNTVITVLDPDGNSFQSTTFSGNSVSCSVPIGKCDFNFPIIKISGKHTIRITPPTGKTLSGSTMLSANKQADLIPGTQYSFTLDKDGQDGWFSFEGVVGQNLSLIVSDLIKETSNSYVYVYVIDPSGKSIRNLSISGASGTAVLPTLSETGTYRVWVNPHYGRKVSGTIVFQ